MALPSQIGQPAVRRRSNVYRRPRRRRGPVIVAALALTVLSIVAIRLAVPGEASPDGVASPAAAGDGAVAQLPAATATETIVAARPDEPEAGPAVPAVGTPPRQAPSAAVADPVDDPWQPSAAASLAPAEHAGPPFQQAVARGLDLADANRPVEARRTLSSALVGGTLDRAEAQMVRETLGILNQRLVFGPEIVPDDPFARRHVVGPGEHLAGIVKSESLAVDWRFVMRINGIANERSLRAGRPLKLITGPFHAIVDKSAYRMDVYMGSGADLVFVCSFKVGLGEYNSTPVGLFRVRTGSKLVNPAWANPRTGERFDRDDPGNPIGERWIGLEGLDEANRQLAGYGIHGTVELDSIGKQSSMGCVRMRPDDIELVYEMLTEGTSMVEIKP